MNVFWATHATRGRVLWIFSPRSEMTERRAEDGLHERVSRYQLICEGWVFE